MTGDGTNAEYMGQSVTCQPERDLNGQLSEGYCQMAAVDVILDCCNHAQETGACSDAHPPSKCTVPCAERWQPLTESCASYLTDYQELTAACAVTATQFLGTAPSTIVVAGVECHPQANGQYFLQQQTIGAKPYYQLNANGDPFHMYSVSVPHDSWVIGQALVRPIRIIIDDDM